jgi:predicted acylesterase/phospholipase RssA
MSTNPSDLQKYDCLVLSGGGAKGAYGAGVAKALWEYRKLKNVDTKLCLVGTSAGALNAAVLATAEVWEIAPALSRLWGVISALCIDSGRITGKPETDRRRGFASREFRMRHRVGVPAQTKEDPSNST